MANASFRGLMSLLILFVILFSLIGVMYIRDTGDIAGNESSQSTVIVQSTNLFTEIMGKLRGMVASKVSNVSKSVKSEFTINRSITASPGQCKIDKGFRCTDIQVDEESKRLYFSIQNQQIMDVVVSGIESYSGIACDDYDKTLLLTSGEERGFILENCLLQEGTSSLQITYYTATVTRGLDRSAVVYYQPELS